MMIYYLKKFWKYMDKYLIQHCIVFILMIFGVFLTLIQPLITKNLINNIINGTNSTLIMGYIFTMAILLLLSLLNRFFQNYLIIRLSNKIMFNLKSEMFEKIQYSLISESKENRIGDLITRLTGDADSLQTFLSTYFLQIITDLLMIIGLFSIIFSMNITIGLIVVCLVFLLYVNIKIFGPLITQMSREMRVKIASMLSYIQENLTNRIFVKAYVLERNSISRFAEFYNQIIKSSEKISIFTNGIGSINNIITSGGTIIIISVSASYILQKKMSVGDLVAISAFVSQIFSPVQRIADMNLNFLQFRTSMDRVLDIVNLETELTQSDREDIIFHGVIEVNNLSFRYTNENVLSDLSFKIEDGEKIKIYGRSGIGKSTLFKILIGFTDKYTGNVLIGNYDIRKITYESLRKQIIIVFQDDYFFHGSILENVNYGMNCSQNQIIEVLNLVELLGDIKNMSEEINTNIGERGSKLSGGQKQRLSIARALLRNPKILILDEATSAVSEEMERKILQNINLAYPKLTLLYVSHRNSLSEIDMKQLEIVEKIT